MMLVIQKELLMVFFGNIKDDAYTLGKGFLNLKVKEKGIKREV